MNFIPILILLYSVVRAEGQNEAEVNVISTSGNVDDTLIFLKKGLLSYFTQEVRIALPAGLPLIKSTLKAAHSIADLLPAFQSSLSNQTALSSEHLYKEILQDLQSHQSNLLAQIGMTVTHEPLHDQQVKESLLAALTLLGTKINTVYQHRAKRETPVRTQQNIKSAASTVREKRETTPTFKAVADLTEKSLQECIAQSADCAVLFPTDLLQLTPLLNFFNNYLPTLEKALEDNDLDTIVDTVEAIGIYIESILPSNLLDFQDEVSNSLTGSISTNLYNTTIFQKSLANLQLYLTKLQKQSSISDLFSISSMPFETSISDSELYFIVKVPLSDTAQFSNILQAHKTSFLVTDGTSLLEIRPQLDYDVIVVAPSGKTASITRAQLTSNCIPTKYQYFQCHDLKLQLIPENCLSALYNTDLAYITKYCKFTLSEPDIFSSRLNLSSYRLGLRETQQFWAVSKHSFNKQQSLILNAGINDVTLKDAEMVFSPHLSLHKLYSKPDPFCSRKIDSRAIFGAVTNNNSVQGAKQMLQESKLPYIFLHEARNPSISQALTPEIQDISGLFLSVSATTVLLTIIYTIKYVSATCCTDRVPRLFNRQTQRSATPLD